MDVTKPYKFIGFGAMDVTKPYEFIGCAPALWAPGTQIKKPRDLNVGLKLRVNYSNLKLMTGM